MSKGHKCFSRSWSLGSILARNCITNVTDSLPTLNLDYGTGRDDNGDIFYMVEDSRLLTDGAHQNVSQGFC